MNSILKHTFTFDLYIRNKEKFHRWVKETKDELFGNFLFWLGCMITAFVLLITAFNVIDNRKEISTYDYDEITDDLERYDEDIPEYRVMLKKAMKNDEVNEMEYDELNQLIYDYTAEQRRLQKIKMKSKVTDLIK